VCITEKSTFIPRTPQSGAGGPPDERMWIDSTATTDRGQGPIESDRMVDLTNSDINSVSPTADDYRLSQYRLMAPGAGSLHLPVSETYSIAGRSASRHSETLVNTSTPQGTISLIEGNQERPPFNFLPFSTFHLIDPCYDVRPKMVALLCDWKGPQTFTSSARLMRHIMENQNPPRRHYYFCPLTPCPYSSEAALMIATWDREPDPHVVFAKATNNVMALLEVSDPFSKCITSEYYRSKIFLGFEDIFSLSCHMVIEHPLRKEFPPSIAFNRRCFDPNQAPRASTAPDIYAGPSLLKALFNHPLVYCRCNAHTAACTKRAAEANLICLGCSWLFPWEKERIEARGPTATIAILLDRTSSMSRMHIYHWATEIARMYALRHYRMASGTVEINRAGLNDSSWFLSRLFNFSDRADASTSLTPNIDQSRASIPPLYTS
jgi:hypothetical protein